MKKLKLLLVLVAVTLTAISCDSKGDSQKHDQDQSTSSPKKAEKILVLYYSQTGTTRAVAQEISKRIGADIEEIVMVDPYEEDYDATIKRCLKEREQGFVPSIQPVKADISRYDVIFIGYPVWFGTYAPPKKIIFRKMKRPILLLITFIFSILTAFSQHTPQQIAELRKQMEERTEKYDDEVQLDSLHRECLELISWCDQQLKNGKAKVYAERAYWRSYLARIESAWTEGVLFWRNRTAIEDTPDEDWRTWDATTMTHSVMRNYKLALDDAQASQQPAGPYLPLFTNNHHQSIPLEVACTTLYDLIANNFIQTIIQGTSYDSIAYQTLSLEDAVLDDGRLL